MTKDTDAGAPAADATINQGGSPRSSGPKVEPVLQLDGLRLKGAGTLFNHGPLLLVRILRGELGMLRAQSKK